MLSEAKERDVVSLKLGVCMRMRNTRVTRVLSRATAGLSVLTLSASLLGLSAAPALAAGCQQGTDYTLTTSGGEYILTFTNSAG